MVNCQNNAGYQKISTIQNAILLILRLVVGWHLLYEGIAKLLTPGWTSAGYLRYSRWILADFFHGIASNPTALQVVDLLNVWGLILIGLALILGIFVRLASISGILLLLLYYIANPPFIGTDFGVPAEGHYLIVNKNLIEMIVLALIAVHPNEAFQFAFENGTDFVCVGMFDFQVRDNVRTAKKILTKNAVKNRTRRWA